MEHKTLRAANDARQAEWAGGVKLSLAYKGNELAGEAGEACNVIKKLERERLGIAGSRDTVEHLAEELSDVVICIDLIAIEAALFMDPMPHPRTNSQSIAHLGNQLGALVGRVCEAIEGDPRGNLHYHCWNVLRCVAQIAANEGIDLDAAVAAKFNATSAKVGLNTRLVP